MKLIKLDAIDSTNDFLKGLSKDKNTENFTVVSTLNQTNGKGQMGAKWHSEIGNNLTMSILIKDYFNTIDSVFNVNTLVAVSIIQVLENLNIPNLNIKWPNDIMAEGKKIGGILIENTIKNDGKIETIIGIGLNINQTNFENLPKASSLKNCTKKEFDIQIILEQIVNTIKCNIDKLVFEEVDFFWNEYEKYLFKKNIPTVFVNTNKHQFMGIIKKVTRQGKLEVFLEDDSLKCFDFKEISMIY